jgi:hypothetical protein
MQRHARPAIVSSCSNSADSALIEIKTTLEQSYWKNNFEGTFEFQFLSDNMAITNTISPHYFQLIRYTPSFQYESFQTTIPGRLNGDGTFEYGGGRLGKLVGNQIIWNDKTIWNRVAKMPKRDPDILDLNQITGQARLDSRTLWGVYERSYMY